MQLIYLKCMQERQSQKSKQVDNKKEHIKLWSIFQVRSLASQLVIMLSYKELIGPMLFFGHMLHTKH